LTLNFTLTACYVLAGTIDLKVAELLDETARKALEWSEPPENPTETILLRLALLVLMAISCYVVQVLLVRQQRIEEEAREFAFREGQLRSAGRLAAEFAHQIKNPLAIINNAIFSLQRALKQGRNDVAEQIRIIQEEVQRSDRIITQVMGYAQLSEGRVERLDVIEELNHAIDRVFPPAAGYPVEVKKDFPGAFPPLLMQRRHLSESFINVLQNAREAVKSTGGKVQIRARSLEDRSVEVVIEDNGTGIPPDRLEQVFEAYYTTKEKGTGLGLATVKNNVELYGGRVRVESELGKGARFILSFPAKTLVTSTGQT
jgi:signal transduction histidine kinase